jgi:cell division protein FtsL
VANVPKNIGEMYAERAMRAESESAPSLTIPPAIPPSESHSQSGPLIYGGTMPPPSSQDEFARQSLAARNKAGNGRKHSPFNLMLTMILLAVAIVLYVGNVIAVQQLIKEVSDEQAQLQQILNEQELLKAQINKMSSLERIRSMAENELGLHNPQGPPQWIEIDGSKERQIQQELSSQQTPSQKSGK